MYLGESFEAILEEHEIDPTNYEKVISDVDVHLWQKIMEAKLESMYSNPGWKLVEATKWHKVPVGLQEE